LAGKPRGRKAEEQRLLDAAQEAEVRGLIRRQTPDERTHPPRAAYRVCAGSALDLTGVLWSAGKDRERGG
jgi:hypothetical protein